MISKSLLASLFRSFFLAVLTLSAITFRCEAVESYVPSHPDQVLESWRWRVFSELKGLGLRAMAESEDRLLWFGIDQGVLCYDGLNWTTYTPEDGLIGAPVNVLYAGRDGSVYAGTDMGISRFRDGSWSRLFPPEGELPWPIDQIIEDSADNIWAATAWGALRLNDRGAVLYTTEEMGEALRTQAPYVELFPVPDEVVPQRAWGKGAGVKALKGGYLGVSRGGVPMVIWALATGGPGEIAGLQIGDHILSIEGTKPVLPHLSLAGSPGSSLTMEVKRPGVPEPLSATVVLDSVAGFSRGFSLSTILEDRDQNLWFGLSWGGEMVRFNPYGSSEWRLYTSEDGLGLGDRPRMTQTRDGVIWTVSNHFVAGVNRFDGQVWKHIRLSEVGGNDINTSLLETGDGTLWVGGHGGRLHALRNGSWTVHGPFDTPVSEARVADLLESSDQSLWIAGLGQEVARLDYGTSRWTTYENLNFQCEMVEGDLWFLTRDGGAVRRTPASVRNEGGWTRYGVEDGLMESTRGLLATQEGKLWAVGQHEGVAATAQFGGERWALQKHPHLAASIDERGAFETADGALWFGSAVHIDVEKGHLGGILRYGLSAETGERIWSHHLPPEAPSYAYGVTQTADGTLWCGGSGLQRFDGKTWSLLKEPKGITSWIHGLLGARGGGLWAGTRSYGLFHFDGQQWAQYGVKEGVANNRIKGVYQTDDGSIWALTDKGVSRFDGQTWVTQALPLEPKVQPRSLRQGRDGALWINDFSLQQNSSSLLTLRYYPETDPPETEILPEITRSLDKVAQPGNTTLAWQGSDRWRRTADGELQYSWRLNEGAWTPYSKDKSQIFFALDSGDYVFEVKARDRDFNEDPLPAVAHFTVLPPIWKQPWFIGLVSLLFIATAVQTGRVVRRDRRLQETNRGLQDKTRNLEEANRQIQEASRQVQEANRHKSQFLANMSHELRTPLNAILGFSQLMTRDRNFSIQQRENLDVINRSGEHLLALINDILEMSKIEAGQAVLNQRDFDLHFLLSTVEGMFRLRAESKGIDFTCERSEAVPRYVHADESKLRQVLINLLGNAIKFTEKGRVALRIGLIDDTSPSGLAFSVEDTGVGIERENFEALFDAFVQTASGVGAQEGTGLGLPISQQFVQLMGGKIAVESEVEEGSVFSFDIPVQLADAVESREAPLRHRVVGLEPDQPVYRILIVEDRLENRKLLVHLLRPLGFEVREAENGQECLEVWSAWEPHLIWMDMRMPVMNGYEATRRIKATAQGQATVVIALTASAFAEQRSAILAEGCDDFVGKPFREEEIFAAMTKHLGVRFVFEEEVEKNLSDSSLQGGVEKLESLPEEWVLQLHRAAARADDEKISELLSQIEGEHAELAGGLAKLVRDFHFDQILDLTRRRVDRSL